MSVSYGAISTKQNAVIVKVFDLTLQTKSRIAIIIKLIEKSLDYKKLLYCSFLNYFDMRSHLTGYYDYLNSLEKNNKIIIYNTKESFRDSFCINGYSVAIWSPSLND